MQIDLFLLPYLVHPKYFLKIPYLGLFIDYLGLDIQSHTFFQNIFPNRNTSSQSRLLLVGWCVLYDRDMWSQHIHRIGNSLPSKQLALFSSWTCQESIAQFLIRGGINDTSWCTFNFSEITATVQGDYVSKVLTTQNYYWFPEVNIGLSRCLECAKHMNWLDRHSRESTSVKYA